jgi:hypothetical protein
MAKNTALDSIGITQVKVILEHGLKSSLKENRIAFKLNGHIAKVQEEFGFSTAPNDFNQMVFYREVIDTQ